MITVFCDKAQTRCASRGFNKDDNTGSISVLLGNGDGTFQSAQNYETPGYSVVPFSVAVGDFNNDGNLDIVTANQGDPLITILHGKEDGTFQVQYS